MDSFHPNTKFSVAFMLKVLIVDFIASRERMHNCQGWVEGAHCSSPSALSTHRSQDLFYQASGGERSQLMLMHENPSSPDRIKSVEADCKPQSRSLGSPGRWKSSSGWGGPAKQVQMVSLQQSS